MKSLNFTLIADGRSDKTLIHIIKWSLDNLFPTLANNGVFADFGPLKNPPAKGDIANQIAEAKKYYPFDLIIYHRDAEIISNTIINQRKEEVLKFAGIVDNLICIVPIVMMEAWLLFDELSIKKAAENRNYKGKIQLPSSKVIENEREPKKLLQDLLKTVSCKTKRNLKTFNINKAIQLVAENITDFSPLRNLTAFNVFENDLKNAVNIFLNK